MSKNIYSLVDDIYKLMVTKEADESVDVEAEIDKFGEAVKDLMRTEFARDRKRDTRTLRLSNIGRDDRYLWNVVNGTEITESIKPHTYIKFMYGHLIEEMLHMDCKIDGVVIDVKSASSYGFKKFKEGTLAMEDSFGYVDQIKAYAHACGETKFGWLAMDKANGHLTVLQYDLEDTQAPVYEYIKGDITERIREVKKLVGLEEPLTFCDSPVPDGKSGNIKLGVKCSYCQYKKHCHPEVRKFAYSYGPKFLIHVEYEPKVMEVDIE